MPPKDNPQEPLNEPPSSPAPDPEILEIKKPKPKINKRYLIVVSVICSVLLLSGAAFALKISQNNPGPVETANTSTEANRQTEEVEDTAKKKSTEDDKKNTSKKTTNEPTDSQPAEQPHSSNSPPLNTIPVSKYEGFDYYYAGGSQAVVASGASATFSQASPEVNNSATSHNHSLIEMAVQSANGNQTVEVGWNVDPIMYGDSKPHLFVFHWIDGEGTCYDACGFVQVSD
ncbi:MAG TPA: neprosin family prolyl endopeptidase, partial [Candidatus Saccharimonadales bacterium]|nr:neprosin family prolyl endopeptidase [Candidatus Saccharimonadales bacterium]